MKDYVQYIDKLYEDITLDLQNKKASEESLPEFIILIGIPGSGKSFWISKVNNDNKYLVISPDEIRREILRDVSDQSQNSKVWMITKQRVKDALKNGKSVILDATMTNSRNRKDFIKDLPKCILKAKIFNVDPEVSKQRIKKDIESGRDRAKVPDDVIDRMHNELIKDIDKIEDEGFQII